MASLEKKTNEIIIEDGSKTYEIKNRQGKKLAEFCFRPADTNILARYEDVRKFFNEFKLQDEDDITECQQKVIEQLDYLTDADTGNTFFSIMGPFSPMPDGSLFCETCLDTVCSVIMEIADGLFSQVLYIRQKKTKGKKLEKWEMEFYRNNKELIDLKQTVKKRSAEEEAALNELFGIKK